MSPQLEPAGAGLKDVQFTTFRYVKEFVKLLLGLSSISAAEGSGSLVHFSESDK